MKRLEKLCRLLSSEWLVVAIGSSGHEENALQDVGDVTCDVFRTYSGALTMGFLTGGQTLGVAFRADWPIPAPIPLAIGLGPAVNRMTADTEVIAQNAGAVT